MVFEIKYTDNELIDILKDLAVELERTPTMKDMMKRDGPPYPSLYQKRFSSGGLNQDGWNNALEKAGLGFNRKKVDQESECVDCGVDAQEINIESKFSSHKNERGTLHTEWDIITIQCPKCKKKEDHNTPYVESDGSFYSMSQPDG